MKTTAQEAKVNSQNSRQLVQRRRPAQGAPAQTAPDSALPSSVTQLTLDISASPRVQALVQLREQMHRSPRTLGQQDVPVNDDKGLEHEADVMGAKALVKPSIQLVSLSTHINKSQLKDKGTDAHRSLSPQITTAQGISGPSEHPIQRLVAPIVLPGVQLAGNTLAKFQEAIAAANLPAIGPPAGITVGIAVDNRSEPNPAVTRLSNMIGIDIEMHIRKWYLDISSVGEISGLIAHELGVHNLANLIMSNRAKRRERRRNAQGAGFQVGVGGQQIGVAGWNAPGANRDAQGRQRDHVNVVRDQGGVAGNASARTRVYVDTMLAMGDNIFAGAAVGPAGIAARNRKLQDLLQTFLFDYSRILATDDGGPWATFSNAGIIAHVMQWYQNVVVARHAAAHAWLALPAVQVNAGKWGIRAWLLGKLARYVVNRTGNAIVTGAKAAGRAVVTGARAVGNLLGRLFG